jgi:hypothetical protein
MEVGETDGMKPPPDPHYRHAYRAIRSDAFKIWHHETCAQSA